MEINPIFPSEKVSKLLLSFLSHEMMNRFNVLLNFSESLCQSNQLQDRDRFKAERLSRASHEAYKTAEDVMRWRRVFNTEEILENKTLGFKEIVQMVYDLNEKMDDATLTCSLNESNDWSFQFVPSHLKVQLEFFVDFFRKSDSRQSKKLYLDMNVQKDQITLVMYAKNTVDVIESQCNQFQDAATITKPYDSFTLGYLLTNILAETNQSKIQWKKSTSDFSLMIEIPAINES
jgi:hypothetical protein